MGRSSPQVKQTIGFDYAFRSGKYQGKTVKEIVEDDPNYLLYLHKMTDMDFDHTVISRAEEESVRWNP